MKWITFLLFAAACQGSTIHEQFVSAIADADLIVVEWRDLPEVSALGIRPEKARYVGKDRVRQFISHVQFEADLPHPEPNLEMVESTPDGVISIPRTRSCRCDGSHLIRAFRDGHPITEITYLHSKNLRSPLLEGGDVELTTESQEWLRSEIGWDHDISLLEKSQKQGSIKSPQPTIHGSAVDRG